MRGENRTVFDELHGVQLCDWPERCRAIRQKLRLSQRQAAKKIGASRRTWIAWERGQNSPSFASARLLEMLESGKIR